MRQTSRLLALCAVVSSGCGVDTQEAPAQPAVEVGRYELLAERNPSGIAESAHLTGSIDLTNPFFQPFGSNPRTCASCHSPDQGWTMTPDAISRQFRDSDGLGPLFNLVDEGNKPDAGLATRRERRKTFQDTLLERGLTRFTRTVSPAAQFTLVSVTDPYGWATVTPPAFQGFRRPNPMMNAGKVSSVTWTGGPAAGQTVRDQEKALANGAGRLHLQFNDAGTVPLPIQEAIADQQLGLTFAQVWDERAGRLDASGARGGPLHLQTQQFYVGINDIAANDPVTGQPFNPEVFDLFDAWAVYDDRYDDDDDDCHRDGHGHQHPGGVSHRTAAARASIYRGQEIFNHYPFTISGVRGFNDLLGQPSVQGSCSSCHNAPNVGGHSVFRTMHIGTDAPGDREDEVLPVITVQNKTTGELRVTTDLGAGGTVWDNIGKFKVPQLRGLAARPPYFHDGQAKSLKKVVEYYQARFNLQLSHREKKDLEAFLAAL